MEPFGTTIFCDDIRFEQQGTLSLIGCYGPDLIVFSEFPVALPKLGLLVQLRLPINIEPVVGLRIAIYLPGDEADHPTIKHELPPIPEVQPDVLADVEKDKDIQKLMSINYPFLHSPFVLPKEGRIKVRALIGDKIIRIGTLKITRKDLPTT
jgi:hypothetical protein